MSKRRKLANESMQKEKTLTRNKKNILQMVDSIAVNSQNLRQF